jgi:hypothetical protein
MPLVCRHCSRVSPGDARYCYHDGVSLVGAAGPASRLSFPAPFVFPSGLTCLDFDAFIAGCEREWSAAVDLLHQGFLQQFFNSIGRTDLALAAREAAAFPDRDRGLDQLLARLPAKNAGAAKLEVQPKLINLGTLKVGQNSKLELALENLGSRLIFGSVTTSCDWLVAADTGNARLFQFRNRATMPIQVKGQHLRASNKPLEGDLLVESNAGTFRLKVIASVPIQAFPDGCRPVRLRRRRVLVQGERLDLSCPGPGIDRHGGGAAVLRGARPEPGAEGDARSTATRTAWDAGREADAANRHSL